MRLTLYQPEIAQNVGAAIRAAACFDAALDIIEPCGFPYKSREIKRVAMDYAALSPPRRHANWSDYVAAADNNGWRLVLLTKDGDTNLWDMDFSHNDALIVGCESSGAPANVHDAAARRVRIDISPRARALNVSVAAAVALAEARRQLRKPEFSQKDEAIVGDGI